MNVDLLIMWPSFNLQEFIVFPLSSSGLHIIHSLDEVNFIQNVVFYIEAAYKTAVSSPFPTHPQLSVKITPCFPSGEVKGGRRGNSRLDSGPCVQG